MNTGKNDPYLMAKIVRSNVSHNRVEADQISDLINTIQRAIGCKLDLGEQDPFFERIYAAARQVGWGRTTTYGALAKELGAGPEAARDVGQAMTNNPVALIISCHRVLAAGGKVGGLSGPGGSATMIRMLALEGVHVEPAPPAQQSFGF